MEHRSMGNTGLKVSVAGLGCNNFGMRIDEDATKAVVGAALEAGITLFDTALSYGRGKSEEFFGRAIAGHRDEVVIATKFGSPGGEKRGGPWGPGSRRWIMEAVETSLRSLGTDWIDLYQFHFPDSSTPIEETLAALDDLVHQGKVRYIGCSNFSGWQVADAAHLARSNGWTSFVTVQNEWSLLQRTIEKEVVPACQRFGASVLPFFPLASGLLTGKYRKGEEPPAGTRMAAMGMLLQRYATDEGYAAIDRLAEWGAARGRTLTEIALSWLASQPVVCSVIAGATTPEQVAMNASLTKTDLTAEEIDEIAALVKV